VDRNTHQHAVAIVQPGMHQGNYQLLECGGRYISADLTHCKHSNALVEYTLKERKYLSGTVYFV